MMAPTNKLQVSGSIQAVSSISTSKQQQPAQSVISLPIKPQMNSQSQYQQKPNQLVSDSYRNIVIYKPPLTFSNQMGSQSSSTTTVNRNKY